VVLNGVHAYTADGHTGAWLANLDRVRSLAAGTALLHPGHGEPGPSDILDGQRRYLAAYRNEVAALAGGRASLTADEKETLVARMKEHLPTDRLEFLIGLGADAVAAELVARR
jgi:glyoxylase-like metal-dependent hydrolase (beta-lactamase superfamily II)